MSSEGVEDTELILDLESNKQVIKQYLSHKISSKHGFPKETSERMLENPNSYSELLKLEFNSDGEDFSLPTSRIKNRYIALDYLMFGKENSKFTFAERVRSTGLFYPVPKDTFQNREYEMGSARMWNAFEPHLVKIMNGFHLLYTNIPLSEYGLPSDPIKLHEMGIYIGNHGTIIKGEIPPQLSGLDITKRPLFMDFHAKSSEEHFAIMNSIIEKIPREIFSDIEQEFHNFYRLEYCLKPGSYSDVSVFDPGKINKNNWIFTTDNELTKKKPSKYVIEVDFGENSMHAFDIIMLHRKNSSEKQIVLRRFSKSGDVCYLPIARYLELREDRMTKVQLDWVKKIPRQQIVSLSHLFAHIGGQYDTRNDIRAYDWDFLLNQTLRAFVTQFGFGVSLTSLEKEEYKDFYNEIYPLIPNQLRLFLRGRRMRIEYETITDPMGGFLDGTISERSKNDKFRKLIRQKICEWAWIKIVE